MLNDLDPAYMPNRAVEAEWCVHPDIDSRDDLDARMADQFDLPRNRAREILQWVAVAQDVSHRPVGELSDKMFGFLSDMMVGICSAQDSLVEATAWRMALGIRLAGSHHESMRLTAPALGVTIGCLSKRIGQIQSQHALPLGWFNKSAKARAVYKLTNGRGRQSSVVNLAPTVEPLPEIKRLLGRAPALYFKVVDHVQTKLAGNWSRLLEADEPMMQRRLSRVMQIAKCETFDGFVAAMIEHDRRVQVGRAARREFLGKESIPEPSSRGVATGGVFSRATS